MATQQRKCFLRTKTSGGLVKLPAWECLILDFLGKGGGGGGGGVLGSIQQTEQIMHT